MTAQARAHPRHMARHARIAAAAAAIVLLPAICASSPVGAHALGHPFKLPIPGWLYLAGAAIAVAASFVVSTIVVTVSQDIPRYPRLWLPQLPSQVLSGMLAVIGLVWWYGAILAGLVIGGETPLPTIAFWIFTWAGLPIFAALLGNPWPSFSPFRTSFALIERAARFFGFDRLDVGLPYPRELARTPAVFLLFAAIWCELVLPSRAEPAVVAALLLGYTLLQMVGMACFGRVAWLRNAELFEVLLGWFGRVGPLGRRVVRANACSGCSEACDPDRCIDCPECATAADRLERVPEIRPWFAGLTEVRSGGWSDTAFILLALAGVSYDGLRETVVWHDVTLAVTPLVFPRFDAYLAVLMVGTGGLLALWALFAFAFTVAATITRFLSDRGRVPSLGGVVGAYAATLLPIAAGYMLAHYATLVIQGAAWLTDLLKDPRAQAPAIDAVPAGLVWYVSVGAIVIGHIAAVFLAHRIALRDAPDRSVRAGVPLVALMVAYTVFSLWIIQQPLTIEPGETARLLLALER
jgi:hypothetical protein